MRFKYKMLNPVLSLLKWENMREKSLLHYIAQWCWLHCWIPLTQSHTSTPLFCSYACGGCTWTHSSPPRWSSSTGGPPPNTSSPSTRLSSPHSSARRAWRRSAALCQESLWPTLSGNLLNKNGSTRGQNERRNMIQIQSSTVKNDPSLSTETTSSNSCLSRLTGVTL